MSAHLVLAILQDEYDKRGGFPLEQCHAIAHVVKGRVEAIRAGAPMPDLPQPSARPMPQASWYEREPGEDDE